MKSTSRALVPVLALFMAFSLLGCVEATTDTDSVDASGAPTFAGPEYEIPALDATFHVPEGYVVSESDDADGVLIAPIDALDPTITIQVNEQLYDDVDYSEISHAEAQLYAFNAALGFGVADFDVIEEGDSRAFAVSIDRASEHECRYGTIVDGHMVYVFANTGDESVPDGLKADIESIALSIRPAN